jgi:pimeloyl-ACP methyl ester carboxylesterase
MDIDSRHRFAEVEGCRLHWVELGESNANPPLVLLHGLADSHLTWKGLGPSLMRDRRVLIPDLPGHGLSEHPDASYDLTWYARRMARWLETLDLDTVDVVGHSFGGGVAQAMLLQCPDRIRRRSGSARAFARTVRGIIDWRGQRHTFFKRASEIARLPCIAVFWGEWDPIIPASHAQALADCLEGIRVTLFEGCGHYPHHEQPVAFASALRDFLDEPVVPRARLRTLRRESPPAFPTVPQTLVFHLPDSTGLGACSLASP